MKNLRVQQIVTQCHDLSESQWPVHVRQAMGTATNEANPRHCQSEEARVLWHLPHLQSAQQNVKNCSL